MLNNQVTFEQKKQIILGNIERYEDFEEYSKYNNLTREEFEEEQERGLIQEITCGTYNGATDTFDPWEINEGNLIDTIIQDIRDWDLYESLEDFTEGKRFIDYALAYTEFFKVSTIGDNRVYVDLD